jgi:hypothetical protein
LRGLKDDVVRRHPFVAEIKKRNLLWRKKMTKKHKVWGLTATKGAVSSWRLHQLGAKRTYAVRGGYAR